MVKFCAAIVAFMAAMAQAEMDDVAILHPVRDEIVEQISLKATSWKAKPAKDNHLRHRSVESIRNSMGHLGVSPKIVPTDFLRSMAQGASDLFKQITSTFGSSDLQSKEDHYKLRQEADTPTTPLDDDLPLNFSWREKMPECLGHI